jgi:molybdopterin synthase catalytic subunit
VNDPIVLVGIRADTALSLDEVYTAVRHPEAGGIALFVGTVRDHDQGKGVQSLDYSGHPTAEAMLREIAAETAAKYDVKAVAAVHSVGDLRIGDIAVIVAVACAHRGEAFDAARYLIDELKARLPIWKLQNFSDGTDEWVGTP